MKLEMKYDQDVHTDIAKYAGVSRDIAKKAFYTMLFGADRETMKKKLACDNETERRLRLVISQYIRDVIYPGFVENVSRAHK